MSVRFAISSGTRRGRGPGRCRGVLPRFRGWRSLYKHPGQSFVGHEAFVRQHDVIFRGLFRNTTLQQDIEALTFPRPDLALVVTLTAATGLSQMPPGAAPDEKGRLRTRLLQVAVREGGAWKIVAYHNVDVKRGTALPEPRGD